MERPKNILKVTAVLITAICIAVVVIGYRNNLKANDMDKPRINTESDNYPKATFAAGCFWHVEHTFGKLPGVVSAVSGYTGGEKSNPSYHEVCTGRTGHAEAVEVTFEPELISYEKLLDTFFGIHDPTTLNRQGPDVGTQYRSEIFYHSEAQKHLAEKMKQDLGNSGKFKAGIVTQITSSSQFYKAESYHQKYFEKRGVHSCGFGLKEQE